MNIHECGNSGRWLYRKSISYMPYSRHGLTVRKLLSSNFLAWPGNTSWVLVRESSPSDSGLALCCCDDVTVIAQSNRSMHLIYCFFWIVIVEFDMGSQGLILADLDIACFFGNV